MSKMKWDKKTRNKVDRPAVSKASDDSIEAKSKELEDARNRQSLYDRNKEESLLAQKQLRDKLKKMYGV